MLSWAQTLQLTDILSDSPYSSSDNLVFVLTQASPAAISELRLHFLTGKDCYSGHLQGVRIHNAENPFPIKPDHPFALTGTGLYQAVQTVLSSKELTTVQAVLIRLVDQQNGQRYQQFAHFLGSCQDETINCCLPIHCSSNLGVCTAQADQGIQALEWISSQAQ